MSGVFNWSGCHFTLVSGCHLTSQQLQQQQQQVDHITLYMAIAVGGITLWPGVDVVTFMSVVVLVLRLLMLAWLFPCQVVMVMVACGHTWVMVACGHTHGCGVTCATWVWHGVV